MSTKTITDPTRVRAGDVATFGGPHFTITAPVLDAYLDTESSVVSIRVDLGQPMNINVGPDCETTFVSAVREVPVIAPGTTGTATVRGQKDTRVMRVIDARHPEGVAWSSAIWIDGWLMHGDEDVTDFEPDETRPLPTPEDVRDILAGHLVSYRRDAKVLHDAALAVLAFIRGGESR